MPLTEYMKKRGYPPKTFEALAWVRKSPRALQLLDAIAETTPPISVSKLAEKTGIPRQQVHKYLKRMMCDIGIFTKPAYAIHTIGLGTITIIMDGWPPQDTLLKLKHYHDTFWRLMRKFRDVSIEEEYHYRLRELVPQYHWVFTLIPAPPGTFITYRYPITHGYAFILEDLKKRGRIVHYFDFPYRYVPATRYGDYWLGNDFADPFEALKITLENPSGYKPFIPTRVGEGPRDIYDLYLLALLEINALLRMRDIVSYFKRKFRLNNSARRVRTHLNHLISSDVIYGTRIDMPFIISYCEGVCLYMVFGYVSSSSLWDLMDFFARYPFRGSILANTQDCAVALTPYMSSWSDLLKLLEFLKEHFDFEYVTSALVKETAYLCYGTIPHRNFDPVRRRWVTDESELDRLDEWLRRRGFDDEITWLSPRDVYCKE